MTVIMKFGGTSLSSDKNRAYAIAKIKKEVDRGNKVVVVVSAMGRREEPYSTMSLLQFSECLPDYQKDRLIAQGEILSSLVFENECRKEALLAHACTPTEIGILTDDSYGKAKVLQVNPMWIEHYLNIVDVVIVPGFIGLSLSGRVSTLGRGGSDKTAIVLADALKINPVYIYTDVDGIYERDPKHYPEAKRYPYLTFEQCLALVKAGACVMMKESVQFAQLKNIDFYVASTFKDSDGTKVGSI